LHNSLGNCTIAGIAQFPLTYTYHTILKLADHAISKMVRYVLL
jgi:hypothetical protein